MTTKGERRYGTWGGNPKGTPEDTTRCIEEVWERGRAVSHHQCNKKRGYGKDGLYCKIHDHEYVKAKSQERTDKWDKEMKARNRGYKLERLGREVFGDIEDLSTINIDKYKSAPDMREALKFTIHQIEEYKKALTKAGYPPQFQILNSAIEESERVLAKADKGV